MYTLVSILGKVTLQDFEPSVEGIVQSFVTRYPGVDSDMMELWMKDKHHWI